MEIGFLSAFDTNNPDTNSGMPYSMHQVLAAKGCRISLFCPTVNRQRWHERARVQVAELIPVPLKNALKRALNRENREGPAYATDEQLYELTRAEASRHSLDVMQQIQERKFDVLFGCCVSTILCELSVDVPIVYFSDSTARVSFDSYPELRDRPASFRRACEDIEREALKRTSIAVFATELARQSAIHDYNFPADRAYTVPMGANIVGGEVGFAPFANDAPSKASVRLVITAADPVRKRVDLAIDVVDILRRRAWAAELEQIGTPTSRALGHPHVKCLGRLSMATSSGRKRNYEALRRSHLMILPSLGEAFGIAPCEAALLGKPSIVSNVGGLPEVVRHDITGMVMGLDSSAEDYANAIIGLAEQPDRYRAMAAAAAAHARANFTWERWGERLVEIMGRARTAKKR